MHAQHWNWYISLKSVYIMQVTDTEHIELSKDAVVKEYSDVFKGLGKIAGIYHIEVDPNVKPVQNSPRRVPIPLKGKLKKKLDAMEKDGVMARVDRPMPWISNMVVE